MVVDELVGVAVAGADEHVEPFGFGQGRKCGDEVVGLEPVPLDTDDSQRLEHLLDQADLAAELTGRAGPVGLVLGERFVAERVPGHVERHRDVGGLLVAHDVDQHGGEAVDGIRRLARGRGEVLDGQGIERPVCQRVPVKQ